MKKTLGLLAVASLICAAPAGATEWTALGPRALGMGGAGVALAQGPIASYWNPAALGRATENSYGFQLPVTGHAGLTGSVYEGAKDLSDLQNACAAGDATKCTQGNLLAALDKLNQPGDGLRADIGAGANFKIGKLALFADGFLDMGAIPRADTTHVATTDFGTNPNNTSKLIVKGARVLEFGAGYGHELPFARGVYLGGNLKLMQAQVGYADYAIFQNNNNQTNIVDNLKNGAKTSATFGVDLGALWDVNRTFASVPLHPRLGLVGRNLNNPKFKQADAAVADGVTGKFAMNPQVRAGLSLSPFHWWNLAADLDLTRNLTPVDNVASRQLGVGTEINVFNRSWINIPLRVGLSRNLAETGSGTMIGAGAGLNFLHFMIDVSGSVSPKRIDTQSVGQSKKIPRELAAAVQISLLFGGSEDNAPAETPADAPPAAPAAAPAPAAPAAAQTPTPAQTEKVKADAEKAQQELDKTAAPAK